MTTVLPDIESEDDLCNTDDDENIISRRIDSSDEPSDDSYDSETEIDEPSQIGAL